MRILFHQIRRARCVETPVVLAPPGPGCATTARRCEHRRRGAHDDDVPESSLTLVRRRHKMCPNLPECSQMCPREVTCTAGAERTHCGTGSKLRNVFFDN